MNQLPFRSFSIEEHVHTLTLTRKINGYEEVSIMDVYRVLSNALPMYALAQRSGDELFSSNDLAVVAFITESESIVKRHLENWRYSFLTGIVTELSIGTTHSAISDAFINMDSLGDIPYRITLRGEVSGENHGYVYITSKNCLGIIRSELDACHFYYSVTASLFGGSLLLPDQSRPTRETLDYLRDLHKENFKVVIQKRVSGIWVDHEILQYTTLPNIRFNKNLFIKLIS